MRVRFGRIGLWLGLLAVVGVFVLWDIDRKPLVEEAIPTFTVIDSHAAGRTGRTTVAVVRSDFVELEKPVAADGELTAEQVEGMVRRATELGGLADELDRKIAGRERPNVVIKVNIVELKKRGSGVITDWRVVKGLIRAVHELAPQARIAIAEGGAWVPPERTEVLKRLPQAEVGDGFAVAGFRQLLDDADLEGIDLDIVDLNFDEAVETPVPGRWHAQETFWIPRTVLEADFLIGVPVLKVTEMVGMTAAMKNFVGIAPGLVYGWSKAEGFPPGSGNPGIPHAIEVLDETIADLVSLSGVDFSVVDAIVGMEKGRTDAVGGRPVRMNAVVAGSDVVAVDAICARLMGFNPDDCEYLALGNAKGLGTSRLADIHVVGQPVRAVARRFEKYPADASRGGEYAHFGQGNRIWLLKGPIPQGERDGAAPDPQTVYPTPGEEGWSAPVYFHDARIDLNRYFDDPVDCVSYAYAEFDAPAGQDAELWVGSEGGVRVWINGEMVHQFEGQRRLQLPNDRVPIRVRKGRNTCLVEVVQGRGEYEFCLKICEVEPDPRYDGNSILGLHYYVPQKRTTSLGGKRMMHEKKGI